MTNNREQVEKIKREFIEKNNLELVELHDNAIEADIDEIDPANEEVWFMECAKGIDVTKLISKKVKLPGNQNAGQLEVVAKKYPNFKAQNFGYVSGKKYKMRQLPIRGTIVVRHNLEDETRIVNTDMPDHKPTGRPPLPDIKVIRHPLFGKDVNACKLSKSLQKRLKEADTNSNIITANARKAKQRKSEEIYIKRESPEVKRTKRAKKTNFQPLEDTPDNLKWLENI